LESGILPSAPRDFFPREGLGSNLPQPHPPSNAPKTEAPAVIVGHYGVAVEIRFADATRKRVRIPRNAGHVVGDQVMVEDEKLRRLARANALQRANAHGKVHTLAANLDVVGIVLAPQPASPRGFIDRAIVSARAAGILPFLLLNKCDLEENHELHAQLAEDYTPDHTLLRVSAKTGEGMDTLRTFFASGIRGAFIGTTGVGKSSILNRLCPGIELPVGPLDARGKRGRHTTTTATLHALYTGGEIVDTPGFRDFRPVELSSGEWACHFPAFTNMSDLLCQFGDCLHRSEPGCGVRMAVESGAIPRRRYELYLDILSEVERAAGARLGA